MGRRAARRGAHSLVHRPRRAPRPRLAARGAAAPAARGRGVRERRVAVPRRRVLIVAAGCNLPNELPQRINFLLNPNPEPALWFRARPFDPLPGSVRGSDLRRVDATRGENLRTNVVGRSASGAGHARSPSPSASPLPTARPNRCARCTGAAAPDRTTSAQRMVRGASADAGRAQHPLGLGRRERRLEPRTRHCFGHARPPCLPARRGRGRWGHPDAAQASHGPRPLGFALARPVLVPWRACRLKPPRRLLPPRAARKMRQQGAHLRPPPRPISSIT